MKQIDSVEATYLKKDTPKFKAGDLLCVYAKIKEEDKVRIQAFEGTVIKKRGRGLNATFTLRRVSYGEGVERTFPINSPNIEGIKVVRKGKVRRAKLYYLRKKIGKKTRVEGKESIEAETEQESQTPALPREEGAEKGV